MKIKYYEETFNRWGYADVYYNGVDYQRILRYTFLSPEQRISWVRSDSNTLDMDNEILESEYQKETLRLKREDKFNRILLI